jgi:hypothetical protein
MTGTCPTWVIAAVVILLNINPGLTAVLPIDVGVGAMVDIGG